VTMTKGGSYFVYLLRCADGTLYAGYTNDVERRLEMHNSGRGAKYTRGRTPVALAYLERVRTKGSALRREAEVKALRRKEKLTLCERYHVHPKLSSR